MPTSSLTITKRYIIQRFLSDEKAKTDKYFWPREMKMAGKLLDKYPSEFFYHLKAPFPKEEFNSLAWFFTEVGLKFLFRQWFEYKRATTDLSPKQVSVDIKEEKIAEDFSFEKLKTLQDFLKYGKEARKRRTID